MRWHYIGDNEYPQEGTFCLCELDRALCVKLMRYCGDGLFISFMDYHYDGKHFRPDCSNNDFTVYRWCSINDILEALEHGVQ